MKRFIFCISALWLSVSVFCQDIYTPILEQIEQNSTTLSALQELMKSQKLSNKTGLTPADPEVEFGYLWGSPIAIGNKKDVSVSQTFDFPTVYTQKHKLSNLQNNSVEYEYKSQRMDLLLTAKTTCIELVYYNALFELYSRQLDNARQIAEAFEKMQATGDANRLEYNKAMLNYTNFDNEIKRIDLERKRLLSTLTGLNGGKPITFDTKSFGAVSFPSDFESWYTTAEAGNPALQYLKSQVDVNNRQIQLSRASSLPKFSIGYAGEFVKGEEFQGVTVGISIPLWENKNHVKQAKAAAKASEQMEKDAKMQYYNQLKNLYEEVMQLQENIARYNTVLNQNDNEELLFKAYNGGELSLLDYLLEIEYYFDAYDKRLQAERDLELALASLNAYQL